jgi:hypothetical protein
MPAPPTISNVIKVTYKGTFSGRPVDNVMHHYYSGAAPTNVQCADMAAALGGAWVANISPLQSENFVLNQVDVLDLSTEYGDSGTVTIDGPGSYSSDALPIQVAACVNWPIYARYRGGKPRTYLCVGDHVSTSDDVHWTSGFLAAADAAVASWYADIVPIVAGGFTADNLCVVSYVHAGAPRVAPVQFTIAGVGTVQPRLCSQRRRLGRTS